MDLYLVRHTKVGVSSGTCYGKTDVGVADSFADELLEVKAKLFPIMEMANVLIYSSPLKRCHKLASALASDEIVIDPRLQEIHFGDWEGQQWDEIESERFQRWMNDFVNECCPDGESYRQLSDRVIAWWEEVTKVHKDPVIVITHSGVIRCAISHILGLPLSNSFRLEIDYGSVSAVTYSNDQATLKFLNK